MTAYQARLIGGDPALDFLNTIHDWTVPEPKDHIATFAEAIGFGRAAGLLTRPEARSLAASPARGEIGRLRELRAVLERMFRASVSGSDPSRADLDRVTQLAAQSARAVRLYAMEGTVVRVVDARAAGAALLRWRVVEAAVALLTSARLARVRACPNCGWFFVDTSKNRSRRWCSMEDCGSITKARRYYRRKKVARKGAQG